MQEFLVIATVVALIAALISPFAFAIYILRSLDLAAKKRRAEYKFFVVDLFSLLFLVQLPLAIIGPTLSEPGAMIGAGVLSVAMILVWWTTVNTVSRAGIETTKWRTLISLIVIPSTYIGTFAIIGLSFSLLDPPNGKILTQSIGWLVFNISCLIASLFITRAALRATVEQTRPAANGDAESPDSF
jgi:hypothetical protein